MPDLFFDRRMSDAEGLMWRLEKDPHLSSTFANVTVLDRPPDFERLRRRMERATRAIPRLRQRVMPAPANLSPPIWVDDPDFDLDLHLRRIALPEPGTLRQLLDLATLVMADPFDRTRPLWQFTVVEGLHGGKAALIEKLHHTISDGERGVQLSLEFLDFERDAPEPPPIVADVGSDAGPDPDAGSDRADHGPGGASSTDTALELVAGSLRLPIGVARQVRDLLADPSQLPDASSAAVATLRGILNQLGETERARSPIWTSRSLRRRLETARAPFDDTRLAAKRLGGTLNTAFLTIATEAAARYHRELGAPTETLRASMAVSTRTDSSGGNAFSLVRLLVPTGDMPVAERFAAIQEGADAARGQNAGAGLDTLATLASTLPTSLVTRLARQQAQTVDFATSNVKGSPVPMYAAGAQLLENYPVGPLAGVAFNLTLLSYLGSLDMCLNIDTAAVAEPELLAAAIERAIADLLSP
ncbi:MAG: wax ester/triacylglycerol synthase domain-containing protein [Ilumatobacteraceae bacterium]